MKLIVEFGLTRPHSMPVLEWLLFDLSTPNGVWLSSNAWLICFEVKKSIWKNKNKWFSFHGKFSPWSVYLRT